MPSMQFGFGRFPLYHQWSQSWKITGANPMVAVGGLGGLLKSHYTTLHQRSAPEHPHVNRLCLTLLRVAVCNKLLPDLSLHMLQMTLIVPSPPCLCLRVSHALSPSLTSVMSWKERHTNCAAPRHCCLPTSLCFQPH